MCVTKRRIYPLRTSSLQWKIVLYSKHKCSDMCKLSYVEHRYHDTKVMVIVDNPNYNEGKCIYSDTLNPSIVQISAFDPLHPRTMDGDLLFGQQIIIPDSEIYIKIDFPVTRSKKIKVTSDDPLGFNLTFLLETIRNVYQLVYSREEQTSSLTKFSIPSPCTCNGQSLYIEGNKDQSADQCPICLENSNHPVQTRCGHFFHTNCIDRWVAGGNETCPLCRQILRNCNICNGTKIAYSYYEGKVLPKELRGSSCRNRTNGTFGIYGYDIDQLYIEEMIYSRATKTLSLSLYG